MLSERQIQRIKEKYPEGTLIRLGNMEGEARVPPGCRGRVRLVDDIGQIHMRWENGSCLALNVEVDDFEVITEQSQAESMPEEEAQPETAQTMAGPG